VQGTLTEDEFPVNPEQQKKIRIFTLNSDHEKEFFE